VVIIVCTLALSLMPPKDWGDVYRRADLAIFEEPGAQQCEMMVQYADGARHDVLFT